MTKGYSNAVPPPSEDALLPIVVHDEKYSIGWTPFDRGTTNEHLEKVTTESVLPVFQALRHAVNENLRSLRRENEDVSLEQAVTLRPEKCREQLAALAEWGRSVYLLFFESKDDEARKLLAGRFQDMKEKNPALIPAPTFIYEKVPFPWEVLYEGDNHEDGDPDMFWGLRYSPARILDGKDISHYLTGQESPSDMLFCLHHELRQTHQREWPGIEKLVKTTSQDRFRVLGPSGQMAEIQIKDGDTLLKRLDAATHNMIHFACHCQEAAAGADALLISLIDDEGVVCNPPIQLDTYTFVRNRGPFQRQPLVFLNACHSGGVGKQLRGSFNLPLKFIERGAAAVIATACPVPDCFAAVFAHKFYEFFLYGKEDVDEKGETVLRLMTIGEALRETRWHFLNEPYNNPLGLAYGLYSPAKYRLSRLLAGGGSAR